MGISGHMLSEKSLRRVNRNTGMNFDRAFIRNGYGQGRQVNEQGACEHYAFDPRTWEVTKDESANHWSSCAIWNRAP